MTCCLPAYATMRLWCELPAVMPLSPYARTDTWFSETKVAREHSRNNGSSPLQAGQGDLDVTIKEANGSERTFDYPYASLPRAAARRNFDYSVTGGQFRACDPQTEKICLCRNRHLWSPARFYAVTVGCKTQAANTVLRSGRGQESSAHGALFSRRHPLGVSADGYGQASRVRSLRVRYGKNSHRQREQTSPSPVIAIQPPDFCSLEETLGTSRNDK